MNSILTKEEIKALLDKRAETKNLDYKEGFKWTGIKKDQKIEIIKDVICMANTQDGGKIVIGVKDETFDFIGVSDDDFESWDQTSFNDFLHIYTEPKFTCQIVKENVENKNVVVIDIPEFQEIPILCKKEFQSTDNKHILKKGQLYIRTEKGSSEIISSSEEMRDFLGRAVAKKGDELLHNIELLLKGKSPKATDDSKKKYSTEITQSEEFFESSIGNDLKKNGNWNIIVHPVNYKEKRVDEVAKIKKLIEESVVSLRGWDFPHIQNNMDNGRSSPFNNGFQSFTKWGRHREGFRVYQSGLMIWKSTFWEDIEQHSYGDRHVLSFINVIWSITELYLFIKRFYELIAPEEDLLIRIVLNGCDERMLVALEPSIDLSQGYICKLTEPIVSENIFKVVELKAAYKELAAKTAKHILYIFNWDSIADEIMDEWQTKLIERKF